MLLCFEILRTFSSKEKKTKVLSLMSFFEKYNEFKLHNKAFNIIMLYIPFLPFDYSIFGITFINVLLMLSQELLPADSLIQDCCLMRFHKFALVKCTIVRSCLCVHIVYCTAMSVCLAGCLPSNSNLTDR